MSEFQYEVISSADLKGLEQEVVKMQSEGWRLQGGICVNSWVIGNAKSRYIRYYQAMVHEGENVIDYRKD